MQLKKKVLSILQQSSIEEIYSQLSGFEPQRLLNPLFSALCNREEKVRWHAVCCFGRIVPQMCDKDVESARIVMRRFLWTLNDESGGIGWGVPEAMAEVMCNSRVLRKEYLHLLVSYIHQDGEELFQDGNYLELPMLQRGLLWGIGRLCQAHLPEMLALQVNEEIAAYLDSEDIYVNALALWCIGLLGGECRREKVREFLDCGIMVDLFIDREMQTLSVRWLAVQALGRGISGTPE